MNIAVMTTTESRALALLGAGANPEQVAAALGITASRISQLVSDPEFAAQVADLRFQNLSQHNARDSKYDTIEDTLLERLENLLPLMHRPMEVMKAISTINGAKRRGQSAPQQITNTQNIVNIQIPNLIVNKFTTNINNQVIRAGEQELLTIQSGTLLKENNILASTLNREGEHHDDVSKERNRVSIPSDENSAAAIGQQSQSRLPAALNFIPVGS